MTTTTINNVIFGQTRCAGNGEVYAEVYVNGSYAGEAWGTNGTQEGEEASFPTVEEWMEQHPDFDNFGGGISKCCPHCGEEYFSCDEQYWNEYPNSSDMAAGQAWGRHGTGIGMMNALIMRNCNYK